MRTPSKERQFYETDPFFRHRTLFILAVASFFALRVLFFPEAVMDNFTPWPLTADMAGYLWRRGLYLLAVIALYTYSYCRNWHFETVAFVVFEVAVCHLVGDLASIYSRFVLDAVPAELVFFSALRLGATACLFLNTFHSHRAPAAPRRLCLGPDTRPTRPAVGTA